MFAHNLGQVAAMALLRPIIVSFILAAALILASLLVFRNVRKAAVFASLSLILFFAFEPLRGLLLKLSILGVNPGYYRYFVPLIVLVVIIAAVWLLRKRTGMVEATMIVNGMAAAVLILPTIQISSYYTNQFMIVNGIKNRGAAQPLSVASAQSIGEKPDVYLIVLDMYGRADKIQEEFAFDDTPFLNQLKSMGFYVAPCSTSNYSHTNLSIASLLNFEYIDTLNGGKLPTSPDETWLTPLIVHSKARDVLKQAGYKFVTFQNGFPFLSIPDSDVYFAPTDKDKYESGLDGFEFIMLKQTPVNYFMQKSDSKNYLPQVSSKQVRKFGYLYTQTRFTLDMLPKVPASISGPKFVYAHIILPHPPYIFKPDGSYTEESRFNDGPGGAPIDQESYELGYTNQLKYVNSQIIPILDTIIKQSKTPPVIILMGDHGFWGMEAKHLPNLMSFYLPGVDYSKTVYPDITPVNAFRTVFNQYLGANYPLLPDRSYLSKEANIFKLTEYIDRGKDCKAPSAKPSSQVPFLRIPVSKFGAATVFAR